MLDHLLEDTFELVLKDAHCGWHDMAQFLIELWRYVYFLIHLKQVDEILRVWFLQLGCRDVAFVIDLLVLINRFSEQNLGLSCFCIEVGLIGAPESISVGFCLVKLFNTDCQISNSQGHTSALIISFFKERRSKLPVGLGSKVLGMVAHYISKFAVVETTQFCADLVRLEGLVEVNGDLGGDL